MNGGPDDDAVRIKYKCQIWDMGVQVAVISPFLILLFNDFLYWLPFLLIPILFGELWVGQEPDVCIAAKKAEADKA